MTRKCKVLTLILSLLLCVTACGPNTSESSSSASFSDSSSQSSTASNGTSDSASESSSTSQIPDERYVEAFQDALFEEGFSILGNDKKADGTNPIAQVKYGLNDIAWSVAQWNSRFDFADCEPMVLAPRVELYDGGSKRLTVNRIRHSLTLAVDGTKEYDEMATSRTNWAHLLVSQSFPSFAEYRLSDFKRLDLSIEFSVTKAVKGEIEIRDPDGAFPAPNSLPAQFLQYLYVQNRNKNSDGYGEFMWFGVGYMDTRYATRDVGYLQDFAGGTLGNFIYGMASKDTIGADAFRLNETYSVAVDVLPHIQAALEQAHKSGFMKNTTLADCTLTGMNIGWEVVGAWDVSATIRLPSLKGILKE